MPLYKLGDLVTFNYGKSLPKPKRVDGSFPVMSSAGITGFHNEYLIKGPGVIVGRKGSIGTVYYEKRNFFPIDTCFYLSINDKSKLDLKYLYYVLKNSNLKDLNSDAAVPGLNRDIAYAQKFSIADLYAQEKVVKVLDAYDNLIENNKRRIAILEDMAQSLYREWFVKFRFPDYQSCKFKESSLGLIPEGWEVKQLDEIATVNPENISNQNRPNSIGYIDIKSVGTGIINKIRPMLFSEAPSRARRIIADGDIIWATVRPNRKQYSYICRPAENTIVSTGFAVLRAQTVPSSYLYNYTTTDSFSSYLVNHATGAAYPAVNAVVFEKASVLLPAQKLLDQFDGFSKKTICQSDILKKKNENLKKQRDLLLPKLISGKIHFSNKEA